MTESTEAPVKRRYVRAVGPRLKRLLAVVFGLFALLGANAVYLLAIRFLGYATEQSYENFFYMCMFLMHLVHGILIVVPVIVFGAAHIRNAHDRPNRRAVRVGYALFAVAILLLVSGIVLTRVEGLIEVKNPATRSIAWWIHVITPVGAAWLFGRDNCYPACTISEGNIAFFQETHDLRIKLQSLVVVFYRYTVKFDFHLIYPFLRI